MRSKTRVACLGYTTLRRSSERASPRSWRVVATVLKKTPVGNRNGKSVRRLTSNDCGANLARLCWFQRQISCTTHAQLSRTTDELDHRCGVGSSEVANSNSSISTDSSKFTKRSARIGGSLRNSKGPSANSPNYPQVSHRRVTQHSNWQLQLRLAP